MIRRLAYRNMKRFAGDYQIYMITLVVVQRFCMHLTAYSGIRSWEGLTR